MNVVLARPHATLLTDLEVPILRADQALLPARSRRRARRPRPVPRRARHPRRRPPRAGGRLARSPAPRTRSSLRTVHDDNARALRLLAGKSDVALNVSRARSRRSTGTTGSRVVERPGANLTYLVARLDRGPFADVRLRPRDLARRSTGPGSRRRSSSVTPTPAYTLIPPTHWAYAAMPAIPFDPAAARALVAEALGSPTARVHATLLTSTDRFRITVGRAMAQELADAGIDVDVMPLELGTMLARLNAGDFELAVLQFPEFTEPNVLRNLLHSTFVPPIGYNRAHVRDAELDALLDGGRHALRRRRSGSAIYAKVEARVRERVYLVPLWNEHQLTVDSERAKGFRLSAEGRWLGLAGIR